MFTPYCNTATTGRITRSLVSWLVLTCLWAGLSVSAQAQIIIVDSLADAGAGASECTLRRAIINANDAAATQGACAAGHTDGTTIVIDASLAGGTIELNINSPLPTITASLNILGPGHGPGSLTLDGQGARRIFDVDGDIEVRMQDLTLTGGRVETTLLGGAAMRIQNGANVSLWRVDMDGNSTSGHGRHGGAVAVYGSSLRLVDSELRNNQTTGSSISGGALYANASTIELHGVTLVGNTSSGTAGGLMIGNGSVIEMINSTISGNQSFGGGGGMYLNRSIATLRHVTVAFNLSTNTSTHGIFVFASSDDPAELTLDQSLVVQEQPTQTACSAGSFGVIKATASLSTHASCTGSATPLADLALDPLDGNGGFTRTHALGDGSIAIGAGQECPAYDQRRAPRALPQGCDLGAVEARPALARTPIIVNTLADDIGPDGRCSLREAIINANHGNQSGSIDCASGGTVTTAILFDLPLRHGTIEVSSQLPAITADINLAGPGYGANSMTLDGRSQHRILMLEGELTAHLTDLTLTGGHSSGSDGPAIIIQEEAHAVLERMQISGNGGPDQKNYGGAVSVIDASVALIDSELFDNFSNYGAAVSGDRGEVMIIGSRLFNNHAERGGAIDNYQGNFHIVESEIHGNVADDEGGAVRMWGGQTRIVGSTLANNQANTGGAINVVGGGSLQMANSTVSGNQAALGAGAIDITASQATLTHATVAFNRSDFSALGSIHLAGGVPGQYDLTLENSLVVENAPNQPTCTSSAPDTLIAANTLSTHTGCTGTATAAADLALMPLADNGGPTRTHALNADSVAIGHAGSCGVEIGITRDQRRLPRPGGSSSNCDSGAYEAQLIIDQIFKDRFGLE